MTLRRSLPAIGLAIAAVLTLPGCSTAPAVPSCQVADAELRWGFKESFRAYIDGSIANGEWTTAGGADYATPEFIWTGGEGAIPGDVAFRGTVRFTGHGGVLDTTIGNPVVRIAADGSAALLLDVSGPTMAGDPIDERGVAFVMIDLGDVPAPVGGELVIETARTTLTEQGSVAFPNYPAGEAFDAVTLRMRVEGCE